MAVGAITILSFVVAQCYAQMTKRQNTLSLQKRQSRLYPILEFIVAIAIVAIFDKFESLLNNVGNLLDTIQNLAEQTTQHKKFRVTEDTVCITTALRKLSSQFKV